MMVKISISVISYSPFPSYIFLSFPSHPLAFSPLFSFPPFSFSSILLSLPISHFSSSPFFSLCFLLSLIPANWSCTYLRRTIWLVQVKKEFCRKCFTFHICTICINQVGFLSFICSLHVVLSVIFVFVRTYAIFFTNIFSFCFWYSAYYSDFLIRILSFFPIPPVFLLDY